MEAKGLLGDPERNDLETTYYEGTVYRGDACGHAMWRPSVSVPCSTVGNTPKGFHISQCANTLKKCLGRPLFPYPLCCISWQWWLRVRCDEV